MTYFEALVRFISLSYCSRCRLAITPSNLRSYGWSLEVCVVKWTEHDWASGFTVVASLVSVFSCGEFSKVVPEPATSSKEKVQSILDDFDQYLM